MDSDDDEAVFLSNWWSPPPELTTPDDDADRQFGVLGDDGVNDEAMFVVPVDVAVGVLTFDMPIWD